MERVAFTLCSNNYLAQAKTLGDSVVKFNPDIHFVIGLVDKLSPDIDYGFFKPYELLPCFDLSVRQFDSMIERYNIVEFNTAVKPFYIDHFFKKHGDDCVIYYIDPDIELFHSLSDLEGIFTNGYDFILTPHLVTPSLRISDFEKLILNVGIYNLGFLGVRKCANSQLFIDWWKTRLEENCKIDFCNGLFVDQMWVNYLPALFPDVFILREPGYNVGYWNFNERLLEERNGDLFVNGKSKLVFFHFSTYNPLVPTQISKWLSYSFEERNDLQAIYESYGKKLLTNRYADFSKIKHSLKFKDNHPHLGNQASKLSILKKFIRRVSG